MRAWNMGVTISVTVTPETSLAGMTSLWQGTLLRIIDTVMACMIESRSIA